MTKAVAYYRTSSLTNADGDSQPRQDHAVRTFATTAGFEVVDTYSDVGVPGTAALADRQGFTALLDRIEANGVRVVIVEDASRFARDLMTQEAGIALLASRGVKLYVANTGDELTDDSDPMRVMVRQIVGAVVQAEKARLVAKLRVARERATAARGFANKTSYAARDAALVARIKAMRADGMTLQAVTDALARDGVVTSNGKPLVLTQVARLAR